jgi:Tfp pilus assembly protein PilX
MRRAENGAALAVTLILLGGFGALALTAATAAVAALALAGHQQSAQQAFEAAEAGIAHSLEFAAQVRSTGVVAETPYPDEAGAATSFQARIVEAGLPGALPAGFSIGEHAGAFSARRFFAIADGNAGRGARARIEQGFYLVAPGATP